MRLAFQHGAGSGHQVASTPVPGGTAAIQEPARGTTRAGARAGAVDPIRLGFVKATSRPPLFAKRPDPAGQHELGKTRRGKPVYASGAETEGYNPDDHQDAARLHHRAHLYHEARAGDHEAIAGKDDEWRRAEVHHAEHGRHGALAEHHHAMARDHLLAGKHGGEVRLHLGGTKPRAAALAPHPAAEVAAAKRRLAQRSHHDHPGGLEERDKGAYARLERGEGDDD